MLSAFMTKLFAFLLSIVAFFTNFSVGMLEKNVKAPDGALRIDYGSEVCEHLNLFIPEEIKYENTVLLMIHGGAWIFGTESMFNANCRAAAEEGFICATMDYKKIQNGANAFDMKVSPLNLVTSDVPPTLLVHGSADEMVPFRNSVDMYNALTAAGVDTAFIVYEGAPHVLGRQYVEAEAARAEAFYAFVEKYCG